MLQVALNQCIREYEARERRELTSRELARAAEVSENFITRLRNGHVINLNLAKAARVMSVLGCEPAQFFELTRAAGDGDQESEPDCTQLAMEIQT